jgi:hypothetical protein
LIIETGRSAFQALTGCNTNSLIERVGHLTLPQNSGEGRKIERRKMSRNDISVFDLSAIVYAHKIRRSKSTICKNARPLENI